MVTETYTIYENITKILVYLWYFWSPSLFTEGWCDLFKKKNYTTLKENFKLYLILKYSIFMFVDIWLSSIFKDVCFLKYYYSK